MAGRPQPGIRDTRIPATMASPYSRYSQYAQGAAQRAKSQDKKKRDQQGGGNFVTDELLGFDDFSWAVKNAQKGNWWDAAKSLGAGVLELGDTVLSAAAIAASGGAATPLVAGKYAAKTAAKQVAKEGVQQTMREAEAKIAKNLIESAGGKKIEKTVLRDVAKDEKQLSKMDVKFPDQMAKNLMDDLNPFQRQRLGQGKLRGKGKDGKGSTGETPGGTTGSQTPSSRPGGGTNRDGVNGSGGAGGTKELVTVGAKPSGVTRYADDFREPLSRPVQPKNTKAVQPGGSPAGGATQEAVEQVLKSDLENLKPGMALPKGKLAPAGILGMGLGAQSGLQSGTTSQVTPSTSTQTTTDVPLQTRTGLDSNPMGRADAGGGGGRRPYAAPGATADGIDVTIPYTY